MAVDAADTPPTWTFDSLPRSPSDAEVDADAVCRICREGSAEGPLTSPCECKGSIKWVHQHCLLEWVMRSPSLTCEMCSAAFSITKVYRRRRSAEDFTWRQVLAYHSASLRGTLEAYWELVLWIVFRLYCTPCAIGYAARLSIFPAWRLSADFPRLREGPQWMWLLGASLLAGFILVRAGWNRWCEWYQDTLTALEAETTDALHRDADPAPEPAEGTPIAAGQAGVNYAPPPMGPMEELAALQRPLLGSAGAAEPPPACLAPGLYEDGAPLAAAALPAVLGGLRRKGRRRLQAVAAARGYLSIRRECLRTARPEGDAGDGEEAAVDPPHAPQVHMLQLDASELPRPTTALLALQCGAHVWGSAVLLARLAWLPLHVNAALHVLFAGHWPSWLPSTLDSPTLVALLCRLVVLHFLGAILTGFGRRALQRTFPHLLHFLGGEWQPAAQLVLTAVHRSAGQLAVAFLLLLAVGVAPSVGPRMGPFWGHLWLAAVVVLTLRILAALRPGGAHRHGYAYDPQHRHYSRVLHVNVTTAAPLSFGDFSAMLQLPPQRLDPGLAQALDQATTMEEIDALEAALTEFLQPTEKPPESTPWSPVSNSLPEEPTESPVQEVPEPQTAPEGEEVLGGTELLEGAEADVMEDGGEAAFEPDDVPPPDDAPALPQTDATTAALNRPASSAAVFVRFTAEMVYVTMLLPLCLGLVLAWSLRPFVTFDLPPSPPGASAAPGAGSLAAPQAAGWTAALGVAGLWILGSSYMLTGVSFEYCVLKPLLRPGVDLLVFWGPDELDEEQDLWGRMLRDIMKESSWRTLAMYCKAMCRDVLFITCLVRTPLRLAQNMVPADMFPLAFFPTTALGHYSVGAHLAMSALLTLLLWALWCTFDFEMLVEEGCRTFLHAALPALHLEGWLRDEPGEPGPALDAARSPPPDPGLDAASQVPEPLAVADQESTPPPQLADATSASRPSSPTVRTVLLLLLAWAALLVLELAVIIVPLLVCDLTRLGMEFVLPDPSPSLNASAESAGPPPPELPGRRIDVLTYLLQLCFLFGALQPTEFLLSLAATFGLLGRVCLLGGWGCAALLRWVLGGGCAAARRAAAALWRPAMTLAGLRGRLFQAAYDDLYLEGVALHGRRPETHGGET